MWQQQGGEVKGGIIKAISCVDKKPSLISIFLSPLNSKINEGMISTFCKGHLFTHKAYHNDVITTHSQYTDRLATETHPRHCFGLSVCCTACSILRNTDYQSDAWTITDYIRQVKIDRLCSTYVIHLLHKLSTTVAAIIANCGTRGQLVPGPTDISKDEGSNNVPISCSFPGPLWRINSTLYEPLSLKPP